MYIFKILSFLIRALNWFSIFFIHIKIRAIASMESATSRARRIPSACPLTARFNSRAARFALRNLVTRGRDQSIGKVTYIQPDAGNGGEPDRSESSPRFRAGLRALITLDLDRET